MWLKQEVAAGHIKVKWIPTTDMTADGLTKALTPQRNAIFCHQLGLHPLPSHVVHDHQIDPEGGVSDTAHSRLAVLGRKKVWSPDYELGFRFKLFLDALLGASSVSISTSGPCLHIFVTTVSKKINLKHLHTYINLICTFL